MYMYIVNIILTIGYITNSSVTVLNSTAVEIHWNKPYNGQSVPVEYNISMSNRTASVIGSTYSLVINNLSKILLILLLILIIINHY